jgi:hypothetical protein
LAENAQFPLYQADLNFRELQCPEAGRLRPSKQFRFQSPWQLLELPADLGEFLQPGLSLSQFHNGEGSGVLTPAGQDFTEYESIFAVDSHACARFQILRYLRKEL